MPGAWTRIPSVGLIQVPPKLVRGRSLFARVLQFSGELYGPLAAAGTGFWARGEGNYWGHNAIIRVRPFMELCGLPHLSGPAPFGGPILSHDFVEAALMRRGGWQVWIADDLGGSYEEPPPTIEDFAVRDRRWCQGNLQHIRVLFARRLHWVSRLHLGIGIMSYLTSPLWMCSWRSRPCRPGSWRTTSRSTSPMAGRFRCCPSRSAPRRRCSS